MAAGRALHAPRPAAAALPGDERPPLPHGQAAIPRRGGDARLQLLGPFVGRARGRGGAAGDADRLLRRGRGGVVRAARGDGRGAVDVGTRPRLAGGRSSEERESRARRRAAGLARQRRRPGPVFGPRGHLRRRRRVLREGRRGRRDAVPRDRLGESRGVVAARRLRVGLAAAHGRGGAAGGGSLWAAVPRAPVPRARGVRDVPRGLAVVRAGARFRRRRRPRLQLDQGARGAPGARRARARRAAAGGLRRRGLPRRDGRRVAAGRGEARALGEGARGDVRRRRRFIRLRGRDGRRGGRRPEPLSQRRLAARLRDGRLGGAVAGRRGGRAGAARLLVGGVPRGEARALRGHRARGRRRL